MAELAAGFLGPALEVVKWVTAPILRQFQYLCCFTANIAALKNEAEQLEGVTETLQGRVKTTSDDVQLIYQEVETWKEKSKHIRDEMGDIIKQVSNVEGGCLKLTTRLSLSKRAKKTIDRLKELRAQCKFDSIARPRSPPGRELVPLQRTSGLESRVQIAMNLSAMNVQRILGMEVLSEQDSWILFKERADTCVDDNKLNSIAKKVVNECKGLPLALTTVGAALKDEVSVDKWKNAMRQLEKGDPDIPGFIEKVYNPLKLSYDVLEPSTNVCSCFVPCMLKILIFP